MPKLDLHSWTSINTVHVINPEQQDLKNLNRLYFEIQQYN